MPERAPTTNAFEADGPIGAVLAFQRTLIGRRIWLRQRGEVSGRVSQMRASGRAQRIEARRRVAAGAQSRSSGSKPAR